MKDPKVEKDDTFEQPKEKEPIPEKKAVKKQSIMEQIAA